MAVWEKAGKIAMCFLVAVGLCSCSRAAFTGEEAGASSSTAQSGAQSNLVAEKPVFEDEWALRVVNRDNPLEENFAPDVRKISGYDQQFDLRAADSLEQMLKAAEADGQKLYLVSAYRSVSRQKALYIRKVNWYLGWNYTQALAESQAARWVAPPGTSEHNLGLAADIVSADWYNTHTDLTNEFENTAAFQWLSQHAQEYGFVLRYPKGKRALTGVEYESWHYRYVGVQAAEYLKENGLCLEEL